MVLYTHRAALRRFETGRDEVFVGKSLNLDPAPQPDTSYDVSQIGLITPSETSMDYPILDQASNGEVDHDQRLELPGRSDRRLLR